MNSAPQKESLPSVIAAGVVAILLALFGLMSSALMAVSFLVMPEIQKVSAGSAMFPQIRAMSVAVMIFLMALSVFGIFVGVGIFRRKNWARITILVWGGFMTFVCLMVIVVVLMTFGHVSSVQLPNASGADTRQIMHFVNIFVAIIYGIPGAIGIWWLILFTRPRVAAAFTNPLHFAPEMDASGFPQLAGGQPARVSKSFSCPVPLAVVAGFMIFGGVCSLIFLFFPFPAGIPFFFFGHAFAGANVKLFLVLFGLLGGIAGVGVLKLKPWALHAAIGIQLFGLLNCAVTFLSPDYLPAMHQALEKMSSQNPAFAAGSPMMSVSYFRAIMVLSTLFVAVLLAILLWQRSRFLAAASAART
ncbi:MAG: hypothetical protein WBG02_18130 [Candidatus Acidiferrum sp.]